MNSIKKGLVNQFQKQCDKNKDSYGKSVMDTAKFIMDRLVDKKITPKRAWNMGMKKFPVHSGMSAAYVAVMIFQYSPRGEEFKKWCKDNNIVEVNWK